MKKLKCVNCKEYFPLSEGTKLPVGFLHSEDCMIEYAAKIRAKARKRVEKINKKIHSNAKRALKDNDKKFQADKAQTLFNKWVRLRDEGSNCISCNKPPKKKNAGHYKSRGAHPELRFEPLNCHLQCEPCNSHLSGNISNYRISLISKIGIDKVEWIEGPHEPRRYTIEDLKEIQETYKAKIKSMEKADV